MCAWILTLLLFTVTHIAVKRDTDNKDVCMDINTVVIYIILILQSERHR